MAQFNRKFERMQKGFLIYYYNIATAKADGLIVCDSDVRHLKADIKYFIKYITLRYM